ncbi:hypothetical protein SETIT_3G051800v2 [Setaria italica]|uniref:Uncharacterized protein n=2 Tax=Setaria italica TaxID=4555 RepID=A0A368QBM1_SETIT|nr:transcription factor MYB2 [Setaria italica]RCV15381.1 hypothetical protein SETIT_3G051800v2 [Setaria italica]
MDMDMGMCGLDELEVLAMSPGGSAASAAAAPVASEDEGDLRRGPWTVEEDLLLVNYIAAHGEGRWNSLARSAGLKRTGKSCRLRWLNYLRPDVRRGNITAEEQLLILELHSRWGNRWSKIAQHLPGRTDNEIKNYWRTRVQKHAKQLRCDVNSRQFRDVVRHVWMPRLVERIQAEYSGGSAVVAQAPAAPAALVAPATTTASAPAAYYHPSPYGGHGQSADGVVPPSKAHGGGYYHADYYSYSEPGQEPAPAAMSPDDTSSALRSSLTDATSHGTQHHYAASAATPTNEGCCGAAGPTAAGGDDVVQEEEEDVFAGTWSELLAAAGSDGGSKIGLPDFEFADFEDNLWSLEDLCLQQLC